MAASMTARIAFFTLGVLRSIHQKSADVGAFLGAARSFSQETE
jgi:hypothetical protein